MANKVVYIDKKGQMEGPIAITKIPEDVRPTIVKMIILNDKDYIGDLARLLKPKSKDEKGFTSLEVLYGPAKVGAVGVKAIHNACPSLQSYVGLNEGSLGLIRCNGLVFDGEMPKRTGAYGKLSQDKGDLARITDSQEYQSLVVDSVQGSSPTPSYVLTMAVNESKSKKTGTMPGPLRKEAELAKQREKQASDISLILETVNIISTNLNSLSEKSKDGVKLANESELLEKVMGYFAEHRGISKEEAEKIASDTLIEIGKKFTTLKSAQTKNKNEVLGKMEGLATKSDMENLSKAIRENDAETVRIIEEAVRGILVPTAEGESSESLTIVDTLREFVKSEEFKETITFAVPVDGIVEKVSNNFQSISDGLASKILDEMKKMGLATGADIRELEDAIENGFNSTNSHIYSVKQDTEQIKTAQKTLGDAIDTVSQNVLALAGNGVALTEDQQKALRVMIRREVSTIVTNSATGVKKQVQETGDNILNGISEAKAQADKKLDALLAGQGMILDGQREGFASVNENIAGVGTQVGDVAGKVDDMSAQMRAIDSKVTQNGDTLGAIAQTTKSTNEIVSKTAETVGETDKKVDELSANLDGLSKKAEDAKSELGERLKVLEGAVQRLLEEKDGTTRVLLEELVRANKTIEEARKETIEAQKQTIEVLEKGKNETITAKDETIAIIKERDDKAMDDVKGLVALMDKQNERYVSSLSLQGFVEITARAMQSTQQTVSTQGNSAQSGQPTNISVTVNGATEQRTQGTTTSTVQQGGITIGGTTNTTGNTSNDARINQLENKVDELVAEIHALANKIGGQTTQEQGGNGKKTPTEEAEQPQYKVKEETKKKEDDTSKKPEPKKPEPNREEPKKPEPPKVKKVKVLRSEAKLADMLKEPKLPWYKRMGKFIMRHPFRSMLIGLGAGALVATGVGAIALGGLAPALAVANAFVPTIAIGAGAGAGLGLIGSIASRISRKGRRERAYTKFMKKYNKALKKLGKVEERDLQVETLNAEVQTLREKRRQGNLFTRKVYKACTKVKNRIYHSKKKKLEKDIFAYEESVEKANKAKARLNILEDKSEKTNAVAGYLARRNKIDSKLSRKKITKEERDDDIDDLDYELTGLYGEEPATSIGEVSKEYKTGDAEMITLMEHFTSKKTIKQRTRPSQELLDTVDEIKRRNTKMVDVEKEEEYIPPVTDGEYARAKGNIAELMLLQKRDKEAELQAEAIKKYEEKHSEGKDM